MIHKFVANDNKGNVNILEVTSTGTKLGKVAPPVEDTDVATKKYVDDNAGGGSSLPSVTSEDNGKVLAVQDGAWAAQKRLVVLRANVDPLTLAITACDDNPSYGEIINWAFAGGYSFGVRLHLTGLSEAKYAYIQPEMQLDNAISFVGQFTNFDSIPIERWDIQFRVSESDGDVVFTGGMKQKPKKYIVTLTPTSPDYSGTMDKTPDEITTAYYARQEIVFDIPSLGVACTAFEFVTSSANVMAGSIVTYRNGSSHMLIEILTDASTSTYHTHIYSLTPAS